MKTTLMVLTKQKFLLAIFITLLSMSSLFSQAVPISFWVQNVEANTPDSDPFSPGWQVDTPWIFDSDDIGMPAFLRIDGNPFTRFMPDWDYLFDNYAYKNFYSTDPVNHPPQDPEMPYSSNCTAENLDFVDGLDGFSIAFEAFTLTGFEHSNMVRPGDDWRTRGEAGDRRIYSGGVGEVRRNGELLLRVQNCVLNVAVNYPDWEQMRDMDVAAFANWQDDIGSGGPTNVEGWGIVDVLNSHPDWVAAFANPDAGNRVDFLMNTVNHVIQGFWGYYSFNLDLVPSSSAIDQVEVDVIDIGLIEIPGLDLEFDFSAFTLGGDNNNLDDLILFMMDEAPQDAFPEADIPEAIQQMLPRYWHFGTTLESFTTDITFDLSDADFGDPASWFVLRKESGGSEWLYWPDYVILPGNRIVAQGVTEFSDWTVGSTDSETLPVVLSAFDATITAENYVSLNWTTQSESNLSGYYIYRNTFCDAAGSVLISNLINGTNSSTPHSYSFEDHEIETIGTYYYWLCQMDINGETTFYGPAVAEIQEIGDPDNPPVPEIQTGIQNVFPNPATSASIDFALAKEGNLKIRIVNLRGQVVKELFSGFKSAGNHISVWDGTNRQGQRCASGMYFVELVTQENQTLRKKLLLVK